MHPQEIRGYMDLLYEKYIQAFEENTKLRRENKMLQDELLKIKAKGYTHPHPQSMQHPPPMLTQRYPPTPIKIHKMGADWHIEGDLLFQVSLMKKLLFPAPICNVKISAMGQVAFTCNRRIFLMKNTSFYIVDENITPCDPSSMTKDLTENFRCIFDFQKESLVIFYKNQLIKYTENEKEWSKSIPGVYHLAIVEDLIYVGTRDQRISIYREGELVDTVEHKEAFKFFTVCNGTIVGFSDFRLVAVGKQNAISEGGRIIALDASRGTVFFGGESSIMKVCKMNNTIEVVDQVVFKKVIIGIKAWNGMVITSTQDKCVSFWNMAQRKNMRIIGTENIIDIAVNKSTIACVDTSGSLKLWRVIEE